MESKSKLAGMINSEIRKTPTQRGPYWGWVTEARDKHRRGEGTSFIPWIDQALQMIIDDDYLSAKINLKPISDRDMCLMIVAGKLWEKEEA